MLVHLFGEGLNRKYHRLNILSLGKILTTLWNYVNLSVVL